MKNYGVIIGVALGVFFSGYWFLSRTPKKLVSTFVVGTAGGYAPFVSVNRQGDYEGFDIDVAQEIADQLGKKLEIKDFGTMSALFMALKQGFADALMWGVSITPDRLEKVAMVQYQGEQATAYPLLFWDKIPPGTTTINDMEGKTISVESASAQDNLLSKYSVVYTQPVDKIDDALLNIQYGKADAALVEPAIAKKFQKKYPNIKILQLELAPEDRDLGVGIALQKSNTGLIEQVKQAVEALQDSGNIKKLEKKWSL